MISCVIDKLADYLYHAQLLVDAVSSFGAEGIEFDAWNIDACAATANKCLHGVPGTAFVIVRRAALDNAVGNRSVYLGGPGSRNSELHQ